MSPTFYLATFLKEGINKNKMIRSLNWLYFSISIFSFLLLIILKGLDEKDSDITTISFSTSLWILFLLSRCSEIFYAFLRDAIDKIAKVDSSNRVNFPNIAAFLNFVLKRFVEEKKQQRIKECIAYPIFLKNRFLKNLPFKGKVNGEQLENHDRLILSFRSYFELIINFSIIYFLLPSIYWKGQESSLNIIEATYFSGVTITTLGYGDISPILWFSQFLSVFEVLCGFTLIVVCLAVYLKD